MIRQRGGLILGLIIGLLVGLGLALAVALYVTKAPVPFVNKVPPRTADQDAAELERNRNWDPNAGLAGKSAPRPVEPASAPASTPGAALPPTAAKGPSLPSPTGRDPAAILAGGEVIAAPAAKPPAPKAAASAASGAVAGPGAAASAAAARSSRNTPDAFTYFVQAGAFQSSDEAEQQRAKLAILGVETKLVEREQSGRIVFRVRAGPYPKSGDAEAVRDKLIGSGVEAMLVRVERPPQ